VKPAEVEWSDPAERQSEMSFEDQISQFLKDSEEKMAEIKLRNKDNRRGNGYGNRR